MLRNLVLAGLVIVATIVVFSKNEPVKPRAQQLPKQPTKPAEDKYRWN